MSFIFIKLSFIFSFRGFFAACLDGFSLRVFIGLEIRAITQNILYNHRLDLKFKLINVKKTDKWLITCYRAQLWGNRILTKGKLKNNLVNKIFQTRAPQVLLALRPAVPKTAIVDPITTLTSSKSFRSFFRVCEPIVMLHLLLRCSHLNQSY